MIWYSIYNIYQIIYYIKGVIKESNYNYPRKETGLSHGESESVRVALTIFLAVKTNQGYNALLRCP